MHIAALRAWNRSVAIGFVANAIGVNTKVPLEFDHSRNESLPFVIAQALLR
jgi:hypothetical protein